MNQVFSSRIVKPLPPLILLLACGFALGKVALLPQAWRILLIDALPLASLAIAFFLSLQFHRSRYALLLILLGLAALLRLRQYTGASPMVSDLAFGLLFLNTFIFSFSKDRALFSVHGLLRIAFIGMQAATAWYLLREHAAMLGDWLALDLFTLPGALEHYLALPDPIVAGAFVCMLVHMALSITANSSVQASFLGGQMGLFGIASTYPHEAFLPFLLSGCALMIAIAVLMDSHDMAYRDELTALPSRRALNQKLLSLGRRYTIAMLDIDHFKKFNDKHGHDVGDEVLRMVASKIARVKGGGKAYRYGGEEFTIVFAGKSRQQVEVYLDELRFAVENYKMIVRGAGRNKAARKARVKRGKDNPSHRRLSVTISIGFAERDGEYKSPEAVTAAADRALYRAKKNGRNCLSV